MLQRERESEEVCTGTPHEACEPPTQVATSENDLASSDEEDYEAAMALGSDTGLLNSAIGSAKRLAAPFEEKLVGLKLARLRRCTNASRST